MSNQHYRATLEDAVELYKSRDLTAKGALKMYFRIRFAPGWKSAIRPSEIQDFLGMPKSTFWCALHKLAEEGEIDFDERDEVVICRPVSRTASNIRDDRPENETTISEMRQPSRIMDEQPLKPLPVAESRDSSYYSIFLSTLSQDERENFEKFCNRKMDKSPFPIASRTAWLNAHYSEYWEEFERTYSQPSQQALQPEIPQSLKDAIADGRFKLERYYSGGEFKTGVKEIDGRGWYGSIQDWLKENVTQSSNGGDCYA